jgi:hypothetical protein
MSNALKTALGVVGIVIATQAAAQVTLYSREDFRGESFTAIATSRTWFAGASMMLLHRPSFAVAIGSYAKTRASKAGARC